MKKLLLALMCLAGLMGACGASAKEVTLDGVVYRVQEDYAFIPSFAKDMEEVTIRARVEGKPVRLDLAFSAYNDTVRKLILAEGFVEIPRDAFAEWRALETLLLPASLERIHQGAWDNCPRLREVVLPEGTLSIGAAAFGRCEALERVVLPSTLEDIGRGAFRDATKLAAFTLHPQNAAFQEIEGALYDPQGKLLHFPAGRGGDIALPEGITGIDAYAFSTNQAMTGLRIPEGVQGLYAPGLKECGALERLFLPASLTHIDPGALPADADLSIEISPENTSFFLRDGALWGGDAPMLIQYPKGRNATLVFPEGIRGMDSGAFQFDTRLTRVVLPEGMERLPENAFAGCENLRSVTLPDTLWDIGPGAFEGCVRLTRITLPSSLTHIGRHAFENCTGLSQITLPTGLASIGERAFKNCHALTPLEIPPSVTDIALTAFEDFDDPVALRILAEEGSCAAAYARAYHIPLNDEEPAAYGILGVADIAQSLPLYSKPRDVAHPAERVAQWPFGITVRILRKEVSREPNAFDGPAPEYLYVEAGEARGWISAESVYLPSEVADLYQPLSVQIKKGKTPLRAGPNRETEELLTLPADGEIHPVLGLAGAWYLIEAQGRQGYLPVAAVTVASLDAPEGLTLGVVANPDPAERLNLRAKPSARAESLGRFYSGAQVEILSQEGDFYRVRIGGQEGYMMRKYVEVVQGEL